MSLGPRFTDESAAHGIQALIMVNQVVSMLISGVCIAKGEPVRGLAFQGALELMREATKSLESQVEEEGL